ncbi:MAG: lysophospholipid acyltransferase family protein [Deltaproteobacteria bacterium]|nr:lysophospholipid acyltransferase family protein [Deltaproteobacteria bacterium]
MPFKWTYSLARLAGKAAYLINGGKKAALKAELYGLFPDIEQHKAARVVRDTFVNQMQTELEAFIYPRLDAGSIRSVMEYEGLKHLERGLESGKGVMLLFAHFGANQMVMPAIGYLGYKMSQISAPSTVWEEKLTNKRITAMARVGLKIRWDNEASLPVRHINVFGTMKEAFLCLRRNEVLGIAIDGGGGKTREGVEFFGKKAFFSTGSVEIAMRTGCVVLPTFMIRKGDGTHRMIIEEPIEMTGDSGDAVRGNISAFVKRLEGYVAKYPCHYLNFLALRTYMKGIDGITFIEG